MSFASPSQPKIHGLVATLAVTISLTLHLLGLFWFKGLATLPVVDFELVRPNEAEFGMTEAPSAAPEPATVAAPTSTDQPTKLQASSPTVTHETLDAAKPAPPKRRELPVPAVAAQSGAVGQFAPHGAQLALRLDLERLQETPMADDVAALLTNLPDVRALLDGSGVDPVHDLSRLFLATPDLRREHVVMAGRYRGDDSVPRTAVDNLARSRGQAAAWRSVRGIRVASWLNHDETPRVLALIGPALFAITREEDLPRVLAVARALKQRSHTEDADALVHMAEGELMNVSVENARNFVHGARAQQAPLQLEASVRRADPNVEVLLHARYPDAAESRAAQEFWTNLKDRYAAHPLVALVGLDAVLHDAKLETHAAELTGRALVPISQARLLLHFLRDAMQRNDSPAGAALDRRP